MTSEQVRFIIEDIYQETVDGNSTDYIPLLNNMMIVVTKEALLYTDINRWRYRFDFSNNILEQVMVYRTDALSPRTCEIGGTQENPIYYERVTDKHGNAITNYFDFEKIILFVPNTAKVTTGSVNNAIVLSALAGGNNND